MITVSTSAFNEAMGVYLKSRPPVYVAIRKWDDGAYLENGEWNADFQVDTEVFDSLEVAQKFCEGTLDDGGWEGSGEWVKDMDTECWHGRAMYWAIEIRKQTIRSKAE